VADYFAMLEAEIREQPYSKAAHRRALRRQLRDRSDAAVERKHGNISAVLVGLGCPYIPGYKPYHNFQGLLAEVVEERLDSASALRGLMARAAADPAPIPTVADFLAALTDPPAPVRERVSRDRHYAGPARLRRTTDYLAMEAANRSLGLAGEEFVVRFEHARLVREGRPRLADRVEHVSRTRGDGLGYDVLSFDSSGAERLIEVKTTRYGRETPFYVSRNEVEVSREEAARYRLYRVFGFRQAPRLFTLAGALHTVCDLDPATYVARVG
jgi:hypothetical protein